MNAVAFGGCVLFCLFVIGWVYSENGREFSFPFLAAAVYLGWFAPQVYALMKLDVLDEFDFMKYQILTLGCVAMSWIGWIAGSKLSFAFESRLPTRNEKVHIAVCLVFGGFFFYKFGQWQTMNEHFTGELHGIATIYVFFSELFSIGFSLALVWYLKTKDKIYLIPVAVGLGMYLNKAFIQGRRSAAAELAFILGVSFWGVMRKRLNFSLVLLAALVGALFVNSIAEYREKMFGADADGRFWEIDYVGNMLGTAGGETDAYLYEVRNGVVNVSAVSASNEYDFGLAIWNSIIFGFVPAQIVGKEFKEMLMAPVLHIEEVSKLVYNYVPWGGTTPTGVSTTYQSFWIFGCLEFFMFAFILARIFAKGVGGSAVHLAIFPLLAIQTVQTFTHSDSYFYISLIKLTVFTLPVSRFVTGFREKQIIP